MLIIEDPSLLVPLLQLRCELYLPKRHLISHTFPNPILKERHRSPKHMQNQTMLFCLPPLPRSSLSSKSRQRRTQLDLTLSSLVIPLCLFLPQLLNSDFTLIDNILRTLLTQILSQTAVLASSSVLNLGKRILGFSV